MILFHFRLFHLQNDEIEEVELTGFDFQHQTLFCANVISDQYLQVNYDDTRLLKINNFLFVQLDHYTFNPFNRKSWERSRCRMAK